MDRPDWANAISLGCCYFVLLLGGDNETLTHSLLDTEMGKTYNILGAEVAQVVEQRTENPRVSGSTPLLGIKHDIVEQGQPAARKPLDQVRSLIVFKRY